MNEYGVFANIVAVAGSLASAVAAIKLAFMKRTKWQPPQEDLPEAAARFAALVAVVFIALIYVFAEALGVAVVALITVICLVVAIVSLSLAIKTNIRYSFYYPSNQEEHRVLGGSNLTKEAASIQASRGLTEQQLLQDAQGDKDLVWTKSSQAAVHVRSTMSFIALIGFGTSTLSAASMLVILARGQ